ncbi:hypothetical protein SSS_09094 [Sarcoptes scabiei]|uniref:Uncharacterized protein n=1 Tax=Sarcoptes scabiei TaxID=52283 RepID=A0A834VFI0_SARSC|nr:hypothetical protein SSS_09094 [Sarcoptes scabiei]UXI22391.1 hypothetical protein NH340_JMT08334 [Sarcoptes scabiei]
MLKQTEFLRSLFKRRWFTMFIVCLALIEPIRCRQRIVPRSNFLNHPRSYDDSSTNSSTNSNKSIGRFQYHQQGLSGPHHISYLFGFVADDENNPLSRHELSIKPGHVSGAYSYIDANNNWQVVQYESHPKRGFRIVQQWTKKRDEINRNETK